MLFFISKQFRKSKVFWREMQKVLALLIWIFQCVAFETHLTYQIICGSVSKFNTEAQTQPKHKYAILLFIKNFKEYDEMTNIKFILRIGERSSGKRFASFQFNLYKDTKKPFTSKSHRGIQNLRTINVSSLWRRS